MKGFRELRVWQAAMDLVDEIYRATESFPKHELFGLAGQMQRAAVSVVANIAEGHGRSHLGEYLHHLSIARGSLCELDALIEVAGRRSYLKDADRQSLLDDAASVARQ